MNNKWGKEYWADLGERVGASVVGGAITMFTADATGAISGSTEQWWLVCGVPGVVSLLKGLLVNFGGTQPTASVVDVTSTGETDTL